MTCTLLGVVTALHSEPTGLLAQAAQGGGGLMAMSNLLLPVFLIGIFYFILIRPQQKRQRELEDWRKGIKRGDEIITSGGLWARVSAAPDNSRYITIELQDKVRVKVLREHIISKAPPADAAVAAADETK
ncbi:MAG: preprotein translocase subunit YajC [Myxococcales bacterium]|nr:preprotein translocase subunit YajC [Myxococcales bacterium]